MKDNHHILPCILLLSLIGCVVPEVIQPMRLYDTQSGNTIEVLLYQSSSDHGAFYSPTGAKEQFQGEYVLLGKPSSEYPGRFGNTSSALTKTAQSVPDDLAELYGFGKTSAAQPAGTGILVGSDSTVIQIVFYRISSDKQVGDGVAKDNKGRYYRIYFSTERQ